MPTSRPTLLRQLAGALRCQYKGVLEFILEMALSYLVVRSDPSAFLRPPLTDIDHEGVMSCCIPR